MIYKNIAKVLHTMFYDTNDSLRFRKLENHEQDCQKVFIAAPYDSELKDIKKLRYTSIKISDDIAVYIVIGTEYNSLSNYHSYGQDHHTNNIFIFRKDNFRDEVDTMTTLYEVTKYIIEKVFQYDNAPCLGTDVDVHIRLCAPVILIMDVIGVDKRFSYDDFVKYFYQIPDISPKYDRPSIDILHDYWHAWHDVSKLLDMGYIGLSAKDIYQHIKNKTFKKEDDNGSEE